MNEFLISDCIHGVTEYRWMEHSILKKSMTWKQTSLLKYSSFGIKFNKDKNAKLDAMARMKIS